MRREPAEEPTLVIAERFTQAQVEQGKALFQANGCIGCHWGRQKILLGLCRP